jgi:hypothetical protein
LRCQRPECWWRMLRPKVVPLPQISHFVAIARQRYQTKRASDKVVYGIYLNLISSPFVSDARPEAFEGRASMDQRLPDGGAGKGYPRLPA